MQYPEIPKNEKERLEDLNSYNLIDHLEQREFKSIVEIASEICQTPISIITLVDTEKQWFKANVGLNVKSTDRNVAFCAHAINTPEQPLIVADARLDARFETNPLVTGDPNIVFYAGFPLVTNKGHGLGTLCVIDKKPRELNEGQRRSLRALSKQVVRLFELRKTVQELEIKENLLQETKDKLLEMGSQVRISLKAIEMSSEVLQKKNSEEMSPECIQHFKNIEKESRGAIDYINENS